MRQKLVVLGTGFAAFTLLREIDPDAYDVAVVSPRNHFLFTPLLPSTTVGTIEFRSIIEPIRHAGSRITYYHASCESVDVREQRLSCLPIDGEVRFELKFDTLVIAVGGVNNTFGIPGVIEHAHFLKEASDARAIRQAVIGCLEGAAMPAVSQDELERLLHFVVVGGGPTGVEFAAELHDFLVEDARRAYRGLSDRARITLLEASGTLLNTFDEELARYTRRHFLRQRIDVRTNAPVVRVEARRVLLKDGTEIPFGLLVWSTGIGPTPLVKSLPLKTDAHTRIIVDDFLRCVDARGVYALGDCAWIEGHPLPATAQVAQQEGRYLARELNAQAKGRTARPFKYRNLGMLAYIGGRHALADLSHFKGRGRLAWIFWRSAYITRLVSVKNKVLVVFDWCKTFFFGRDVSSM